MFKKGEHEGRAVGVLLLVIAFFLVLYVLFLPPEDREALLTSDSDLPSSVRDSERAEIKELFTATPGLLSPDKEFGTPHNIGSVNLFLKTEPKITKLVNTLSISKSLVSSSSPKLNFDLESSTDLDKVTMFFTITNDPTGTLRLKINGREFYAESASRGVKIIEIPLTYLRQRNTIEIDVSHPGIFFWERNSYELDGVGIKQEYERINTKEERRFTIAKAEKDLLDEASLSFYQFCNSPISTDTAGLKVLLNDIEVFSGEIRCMNTKHTIGIDPSLLIAGTNSLIFSLDNGDFSFNEINLDTKSEGGDFQTYVFQVDNQDLDEIELKDKTMKLELLFSSSSQNKNAIINVNSGTIFMKTSADKFEADITALIEQGSNFIKIQPTNTFTITGLKVIIE